MLDRVKQALEYGWTKTRIWEIFQFGKRYRAPVTQVERELMVLEDRWLVYHKPGFDELLHLWSLYKQFGVHHFPSPVTVWGDGSATTSENPAGIGVVVEWPMPDVPRVEIAENIGLGTNNKAELMAVWRGLQVVPDCLQEIVVRTDSQYTIGALTLKWVLSKNVLVAEAIKTDLKLRNRAHRRVIFQHVKGHSGIEQNERCDKLARQGRLTVTEARSAS